MYLVSSEFLMCGLGFKIIKLLVASCSINCFAGAKDSFERDFISIPSVFQRRLTQTCTAKNHVDGPEVRLEKKSHPPGSYHEDPRHLDACRAVHKLVGRSNFSVDTIEDIIANSKLHANTTDAFKYYDQDVSVRIKERRRTFERSPRSQACGMLHPYGGFIQSRDSQQPILYVEIPKTSSSTMKSWIKTFCKDSKYGEGHFLHSRFTQMAPVLPNTLLSFTVVREPLKRFLSGYGTIRHRALLKGKTASHSSSSKIQGALYSSDRAAEIERFKSFVSIVVDEGAIMQARNDGKNDCIWNHVLSQMWFIEMYPQPINFVLHVESLEEDIKILRRYLPVTLPLGSPTHKNSVEGSKEPGFLKSDEYIKSAPAAIQMVLEYLRQDYVCLQYPIPNTEIHMNRSLKVWPQ